MIIFSAFCRLGPFPSVFGKVKEWLMLKSYEIIKAIHVVVCTIVFLFYDRDWQGEVFKVM